MSFDIFKARRNTDFLNQNHVTKKIGPGSYNLSKIPFTSRKISGIAPFSSMIERFKNNSSTPLI